MIEASTYAARSRKGGMTRVHNRLNAGRAITECWIANRASSATSTASARTNAASITEAIV